MAIEDEMDLKGTWRPTLAAQSRLQFRFSRLSASFQLRKIGYAAC
jgi:hypothetical protein